MADYTQWYWQEEGRTPFQFPAVQSMHLEALFKQQKNDPVTLKFSRTRTHPARRISKRPRGEPSRAAGNTAAASLRLAAISSVISLGWPQLRSATSGMTSHVIPDGSHTSTQLAEWAAQEGEFS